jgi:hypothetical protein
MFVYTIQSAVYSPIPDVPNNSNRYPQVFIRGTVQGDIADNGQPGFGYISNFFFWEQIEVAYAVGGIAAVRLNLAPALFASAFWPGPYVDNAGNPVEPPALPDPPYVAATIIQPEPPNGSNTTVVNEEAVAAGSWSQ